MATKPISQLTVGFLGCGSIGSSLIKGFTAAGEIPSHQLIASCTTASKLERITKEYNIKTTTDNTKLVHDSDVVIICVPPRCVLPVLKEIKDAVTAKKGSLLLVSIASGVTLKAMEAELPSGCPVIRVMPNTPCMVQAGASVYSLGSHATDMQGDLVRHFFQSVGTCHKIDEGLIDAVIGVSGSGPAYVYTFIEALSDGGVKAGLPRALSTQLAAQTLLGASKMVLETGKHTGALKDEVCVPGGTTISGIQALEEKGLRGAVMAAVQATVARAKDLHK